MVKLAYDAESLHWDSILRFNTTNTLYEPTRRSFEFSLLEKGFLLAREQALDGKSDAFLKILCPFEILLSEAEGCRLSLPLQVFYFFYF